PNGSVLIPLFSDLRQHNMGVQLADRTKQGADVAGICIAEPLFLTRPLWGVADTGPWLHDGRALTLKEAILKHEGQGSEANPIIGAFRNLLPEEQQAVIDFLLTLAAAGAAGSGDPGVPGRSAGSVGERPLIRCVTFWSQGLVFNPIAGSSFEPAMCVRATSM